MSVPPSMFSADSETLSAVAMVASLVSAIAALAEIQRLREGGDPVVGVCGNFAGRAVQVDLI